MYLDMNQARKYESKNQSEIFNFPDFVNESDYIWQRRKKNLKKLKKIIVCSLEIVCWIQKTRKGICRIKKFA